MTVFHKCHISPTEGMFVDNGKLFSQIIGLATGNLLGPTLAVWFLGTFEK